MGRMPGAVCSSPLRICCAVLACLCNRRRRRRQTADLNGAAIYPAAVPTAAAVNRASDTRLDSQKTPKRAANPFAISAGAPVATQYVKVSNADGPSCTHGGEAPCIKASKPCTEHWGTSWPWCAMHTGCQASCASSI